MKKKYNNSSNCVLFLDTKQIYLENIRDAMLLEISTQNPQNIPESYFMSNKYLCLYFVWKFMNQYDINACDCKYIIELDAPNKKGWIFRVN